MTAGSAGTAATAGRSARGYALVVLAACLWATIGVFFKYLIGGHGVAPVAAAAYRGLVGGFILLLALLLFRQDLRVARRDWPMFLAYGIFGVSIFFAAYSNAVNLTGVALAAVLLYTAPAWVALISWRWLGEHLGRRGLIALALALAGVVLVAQIYDPAKLRVHGAGILLGLVAGLTYGLYTVFNKVLVRRYRPWVVQVWGLFIGCLPLLAFVPQAALVADWSDPGAVALIIGVGLVPTLLGTLIFLIGVQWVPASVASILATLELAVATLFGYVLFGERLALGQLAGGALILAAVILLRPGSHSEN